MNFKSSQNCRLVKLAALREEEFGKLHIKVLLTQGVPRGENALQYALSLNMLCASANQLIKIYEHDKDDLLLKTFTNYPRRRV